MKKLFSALLFLALASSAHAQNAVQLPYAAQAVADIGNGPVKVRVTQGNASIFTAQGSGVGSTSGASTSLTLTATPAVAPLVGGVVSGSGIASGTTIAAYNGTTGITLSGLATVPTSTVVSWGAACPASAAGIPTQFIQASASADFYLLYTRARVCAISPGGANNALLIEPIFYDSTTQTDIATQVPNHSIAVGTGTDAGFRSVGPCAAGQSPVWTGASDPTCGATAGGINIISYGADPTGIFDSTPAIQRALNVASISGQSVYAPCGVYSTNTALLIYSNTEFFGAGWCATIKGVTNFAPFNAGPFTGVYTLLTNADYTSGNSNILVRGIALDATLPSGNAHNVLLYKVTAPRISQVYTLNGNDGIACVSTVDCRAWGNKIIGPRNAGLDSWGGFTETVYTDNYVDCSSNAGTYGMLMTGSLNATTTATSKRGIYTNNTVKNCPVLGAWVQGGAVGASAGAVEDSIVTNNSFLNTGTIRVSDASRVVIDSNVIRTTPNNAIVLATEISGGTQNDVIVTNNILSDLNTSGGTDDFDNSGISVGIGSSNTTIRNNRVVGATQKYTVAVQAGANKTHIGPNDFTAGSSGLYINSGTATFIYEENNASGVYDLYNAVDLHSGLGVFFNNAANNDNFYTRWDGVNGLCTNRGGGANLYCLDASGNINTATWNGAVVAGQYGGTGVANTGKTITLGGNLTTSGGFASTFTMTGVTGVTFPTSGTLATTAGIATALPSATSSQLYVGTGAAGAAGVASTLPTAAMPALTGDITNSAGSLATTLASIITAGGPIGSATVTPIITYDAKGRLTAVSSATITPAIGSVAGLATGVATALGVNVGTAGAFVVNGGALGSPSSAGTIPAHTLGGTVSGGGNQINNVIIGTSTPLAGTFTVLTTTTGGASIGGSTGGVTLDIGGTTRQRSGSALNYNNAADSANFSTAFTAAGLRTNSNGGSDLMVLTTGGALTLAGSVTATLANTATTSAVCYNTGTGLITYDGTIGTCTVSDGRLKNVEGPLTGSLNKLLQINGVYYDWKDPAMGKGRQVGIIAQDVEKVYPELVSTDSEGRKSADYQRLTAPIIEALRELKADNDSLRACNESWKCRVFGWR